MVAIPRQGPVPWTPDAPPVAPRSYLGEVRVRFMRKRSGVAAVGVLALIALAALAAPVLTTYDPLVGRATERLLPIGTSGHLLGTDEQGRDMLTRLLYAGR